MFPIMLQSDLCVLKNLTPQARYNSGECVNDKGGYFIIDGKEKVIVCQEQLQIMLYMLKKMSEVYSYGAEIDQYQKIHQNQCTNICENSSTKFY